MLQLSLYKDFAPGSLEVKIEKELFDDFLKDLDKHDKAIRESKEILLDISKTLRYYGAR